MVALWAALQYKPFFQTSPNTYYFNWWTIYTNSSTIKKNLYRKYQALLQISENCVTKIGHIGHSKPMNLLGTIFDDLCW